MVRPADSHFRGRNRVEEHAAARRWRETAVLSRPVSAGLLVRGQRESKDLRDTPWTSRRRGGRCGGGASKRRARAPRRGCGGVFPRSAGRGTLIGRLNSVRHGKPKLPAGGDGRQRLG